MSGRGLAGTLGGLALGLVLVLAGAACGGGGGGGGGGPTTPPPPAAGITFSAAGAAAPAIELRRGAGTTGEVLVLEVFADSVEDVYGVAFDLLYPRNVLVYESAAEGALLGGTETTLQVVENPSGRLVVGHTRLGDVPGASGSGVLLTLRFRAVAAGTGSFGFSSNRAFLPNGDAQGAVSWGAGTVQVVR